MIRNSPIYLTALAHDHYVEIHLRTHPSATAWNNASATYIPFYFNGFESESLYNESDTKSDREQELAHRSETAFNEEKRKRLKYNPFRNAIWIFLYTDFIRNRKLCSIRKYSRKNFNKYESFFLHFYNFLECHIHVILFLV